MNPSATTSTDNWSLQSTSATVTNIINELHQICMTLDQGSNTNDVGNQLSSADYNTQLHSHLRLFNTLLHELDHDTRQSVHINIPSDIINKINTGLNPDIAMEQLLNSAKLKNDQLRLKLCNTHILQQNINNINNQLTNNDISVLHS